MSGSFQSVNAFVHTLDLGLCSHLKEGFFLKNGDRQSFQPPYHFIVLPRAFHSIFFHLIVFS